MWDKCKIQCLISTCLYPSEIFINGFGPPQYHFPRGLYPITGTVCTVWGSISRVESCLVHVCPSQQCSSLRAALYYSNVDISWNST